MKKLRIGKKFGTWYYEKKKTGDDCGTDVTYHYLLYDENKKYVESFDYYYDMHDLIIDYALKTRAVKRVKID